MTEFKGLLAFGIEGRVAADGRLLSADPHLWQLHLANGGVDGGVLAVPGLLKIAVLCWRTGATFERLALAADENRDYELWVRAKKQSDAVSLTISGWQERGHRSSAVTNLRPLNAPAPSEPALHTDILVDVSGYVLQLSPEIVRDLGSQHIGLPLAESFECLSPDHDRFWEEAVKRALNIRSKSTGTEYALRAKPRLGSTGALLGFQLQLSKAKQEGGDVNVPASAQTGGAFGRHFATAVRQPLSRIIANAETIKSTTSGPLQENYTSYAQDIAVAARHLAELVGDLEDLDAIDRDDFRVANEKVELGDIARRVGGLLALKAADHQIRFELPDPDMRVEVSGEFRRVLQIVLNLVGNAIRYTPSGSTVYIQLENAPSAISVADEGAGIAPEDRERVFEKFERLGRSGSGGSGLGLYISRRLARAMNGDIVITESEQGGAKFTLTLPSFRSV